MGVIAVATLEINCSGVIVLSVSASIRHSKRTINALITKMAVSSKVTSAISDVTTKITTACATGIMVIAVELQAISTSSTTAKNANALTQRTNRATGNVPTLHGKAMETAMIRITIAAVTGTAVTAARKPAASSSSITAQNVFVEIPKLGPSVQVRKIAASGNLLATAAATTLTITAVATGTMVTVAGRMATSTNTSTACNANAKTRSSRTIAKASVTLQIIKATVIAMTKTTIAVATMMVETAAERAQAHTSLLIARNVSVWNQVQQLQSKTTSLS